MTPTITSDSVAEEEMGSERCSEPTEIGAQSAPIQIEHDEKGNINLDTTCAPFDGKPVLIKLSDGWVEAWWDYGAITEDHEGNRDYEGWEWVCHDARFTAELEDAKLWAPLPSVAGSEAAPPDASPTESRSQNP